MAGGRPPEYSDKILTKTKEYIDNCNDEIDEYHRTRGDKSDSYDRIVRVRLPSIEGLAVYLHIHKSTVYEWEKIYPEFSDAIEELRGIQADRLINSGLSGDYNPTIAKVLLTKHGYNDKQEIDHTNKGDKFEPSPSVIELTNKLNEIYRGGSISSNGGDSSTLGTETRD